MGHKPCRRQKFASITYLLKCNKILRLLITEHPVCEEIYYFQYKVKGKTLLKKNARIQSFPLRMEWVENFSHLYSAFDAGLYFLSGPGTILPSWQSMPSNQTEQLKAVTQVVRLCYQPAQISGNHFIPVCHHSK